MCWNDVDTMPHHSFDWEGIDGSRVFTHFTPNNTYNGTMHPSELARSVENFSDHAGAGTSLMPFGYGDGGGGPTREMMALGRLQADLEGSARVQFDTPEAFFAEADEAYADRPVWAGEMYLEFHRGVFTSQSRTKRGNRRNEALLVEAELWWAQAAVLRGAAYPHDELDALWEQILLLQFHDILPGSSIAWVPREAEEAHAVATERLEALIARALAVVVGEGDAELVAEGGRGNLLQVFVDAPAKWDAWELDRSMHLATADLTDGSVRVDGGAVVVERAFGASTLTQRLALDDTGGALRIETDVDWHERHRLLKLAFAFDVHATDAAYETSYGHVRRATHTNTSWDAARYESCAHRYVHVGEPGFGVAVVNDAIYGHDVTRDSVDGRLVTTVRQSLLRAPTFPDPDADQGHHRFVTLVAPAPTVLEASRWGAVVGRRLRGRPGGDPRRGRRPGRRMPGADAAAV